MLIKFMGGRGGGGPIAAYLTDAHRAGREEAAPEVVRGNIERTRELIDGIDRRWTYTTGVISFAVEDAPSEDQQRAVMDEFEALAFAGLDAEQYDIAWVRHAHTGGPEGGRVELHFLTPRMELTTGRALNIAPPGWERTYAPLRGRVEPRAGLGAAGRPRSGADAPSGAPAGRADGDARGGDGVPRGPHRGGGHRGSGGDRGGAGGGGLRGAAPGQGLPDRGRSGDGGAVPAEGADLWSVTGPARASLTEQLQERLRREREEIEALTASELQRLAESLSASSRDALDAMESSTRERIERLRSEMEEIGRRQRRWPLWTALSCATIAGALFALLWVATGWERRRAGIAAGRDRAGRAHAGGLGGPDGGVVIQRAREGTFVILPEGADPAWTCGESACVKLPE